MGFFVFAFLKTFVHCLYKYIFCIGTLQTPNLLKPLYTFIILGNFLIVEMVPQALKEGREPDLSDYKDFKLTCDNLGYQMLQKLGWKEGEGLGSEGQGIKNPVNK